jgi:hypothetical protein
MMSVRPGFVPDLISTPANEVLVDFSQHLCRCPGI